MQAQLKEIQVSGARFIVTSWPFIALTERVVKPAYNTLLSLADQVSALEFATVFPKLSCICRGESCA